jgi:hypothetical protein
LALVNFHDYSTTRRELSKGRDVMEVNAIRGRAIIIGTSLAGLFAATLLRKAGWHTEVFERSDVELTPRAMALAHNCLQTLAIGTAHYHGSADTSRWGKAMALFFATSLAPQRIRVYVW